MKRARDCDAETEARPYKHLKEAQLPDSIQALPHVLKGINEFAMSVEEAAREAASTGRASWLKALLPRIEGANKVVAQTYMEIGAEYGHCDVIRTAYKWWELPDDYVDERKYPMLSKAVSGGHADAVALLMEMFDWGIENAVITAQDDGQQDMVELICQLGDYQDLLECVALNLPALKILLPRCDLTDWKDIEILFRTMYIAVSEGFLEVVKFLHEKCGRRLYDPDVVENHPDYDHCLQFPKEARHTRHRVCR